MSLQKQIQTLTKRIGSKSRYVRFEEFGYAPFTPFTLMDVWHVVK